MSYQRNRGWRKWNAPMLLVGKPHFKIKLWMLVQVRARILSEVLFIQSYLCDPMDCSPPGSSVHGLLQARILEWVAMSSSRGSSRSRDQTWIPYISCTGRQFLYHLVLAGKSVFLSYYSLKENKTLMNINLDLFILYFLK